MRSDFPDLVQNIPLEYVEYDNNRIAYRIIGTGLPVVLIMGVGGTMNEWDRSFLSGLASEYRLILLDNRGIGDSSANNQEISISDMAGDVAALIHMLGLSKVHILGYSMGSMVSLEIARRWPDLPSSLILYAPSLDGADTRSRIDPFVDPSLPEIIRIDALFPEEWLSAQFDLTSLFPAPVHPVNGLMIFKQLDAIQQWKIENIFFFPFTARVLVLVGSEDLITPPIVAWEVARAFSGSTFITLDGGGHGVLYQKPEVIVRYIKQFLSEISLSP